MHSGHALRRPRIGLVVPRFTLFDAHMLPGFVERMRAAGPHYADTLGRWFDICFPGVIESDEQAGAAAARIAEFAPDAIVLAPAMAAPPSFGWAVCAALPDVPAVLWNAVPVQRMSDDLSQAEATENSTTVGCIMLGNVLVRAGRPAPAVTTGPGDADGLELLRRTIRGAAAAGALRGRSLLRIGAPIAGYLDVEATDEELAAVGMREVDVGGSALLDAFAAASDADGRAVLDECRAAGWAGDPGSQGVRSGRLAHAVRGLMTEHRAVGGTVNCHGPLLRFGPDIGIAACLAVARESAAGRPLSCTGDQPAGLTLALARRMGDGALYHECYAPEPATGLMLIAAGGEGDPALAEGSVTLEENDHYPGEAGRGTSVSFALRRGPATILSASPAAGGWRLAWATGEVVQSRYSGMRGPNGMFRFDSGDAATAASSWIGSGATHHNALAPGRLDVEIETAAAALGMASVRI